MDPEYARHYRELYERHWWWRAREAALLAVIDRLRPACGWTRILDVGCGDGLFFNQLLQFAPVDGVEPAGELLDPNGRHRSRIHVGPFDNRFRPGVTYDLILMLDVIEHLDNPVAAVRRGVELLTPTGLVIITVPAFMTLWTNHDVLNHHKTRYTKRGLREVARQAGLHVLEDRYWFQWMFAAKIAARAVEVALRSKPAPATVPPWWINRPLYALSRLEHKLLTPLNPPFGSSLLLIGRLT